MRRSMNRSRWVVYRRFFHLTIGFVLTVAVAGNVHAASECNRMLLVDGLSFGGLPLLEEFLECGRFDSGVRVRVRHFGEERDFVLSIDRFNFIKRNIERSTAEEQRFPSSRSSCSHPISVVAEVAGVKRGFRSCPGDPRHVIAEKMQDVIQHLYTDGPNP